jgi:hypothetical protein
MEMVPLRNRLMQCRSRVDVIALEHGDRREVVGEHPGGHESREAAADDHCVLTKVRDHQPSLLIVESPQETPH